MTRGWRGAEASRGGGRHGSHAKEQRWRFLGGRGAFEETAESKPPRARSAMYSTQSNATTIGENLSRTGARTSVPTAIRNLRPDTCSAGALSPAALHHKQEGAFRTREDLVPMMIRSTPQEGASRQTDGLIRRTRLLRSSGA